MPVPRNSSGESERPQRREGGSSGPRKQFFRRRKVCKFCEEKIDVIDYKDARLVGGFVSERGKILPRRLTGTCCNNSPPRWTMISMSPPPGAPFLNGCATITGSPLPEGCVPNKRPPDWRRGKKLFQFWVSCPSSLPGFRRLVWPCWNNAKRRARRRTSSAPTLCAINSKAKDGSLKTRPRERV